MRLPPAWLHMQRTHAVSYPISDRHPLPPSSQNHVEFVNGLQDASETHFPDFDWNEAMRGLIFATVVACAMAFNAEKHTDEDGTGSGVSVISTLIFQLQTDGTK